MSERRYIDADALYEMARTNPNYKDFCRSQADLTSLRELLDEYPSADVEPVVRGEWVKKPLGIYYCSVCDEFVGSRGDEEYCEYDFCPHCGAVMTEAGMKKIMERSGER